MNTAETLGNSPDSERSPVESTNGLREIGATISFDRCLFVILINICVTVLLMIFHGFSNANLL